MPAQGRKNVHGKTGVRFKAAYTKQKFDNMVRNVVSELIIHEHVKVTESVKDSVIKEFSRLVTLTKKSDVVFAKREAARFVRNIYTDETKTTSALDKLFSTIGPRFASREGGYLAEYKVSERRGDNAPVVLLSLVD